MGRDETPARPGGYRLSVLGTRRRFSLEGTIAGAAFASGDRFVVGAWERGPLGPMTDVMWARPDGTRVLLAPERRVADFVGAIYAFDDIEVVSIDGEVDDDRLDVRAGPLRLQLTAAAPRRVFALRPRFLRRWPPWVRFEDLVLRPVVGRWILGGAPTTRTYGVTTTGAREWYRIDAYRPVAHGRARLAGVDLGPLTSLEARAGFGFAEFPTKAAFVRCAPLIEVSGELASCLDGVVNAATLQRRRGSSSGSG